MNTELNEILTEVIKKRGKVLGLKNELSDQKKELENMEEYLITQLLEQGMKSFKNEKGISVSVTEKKNFSVLKQDEFVFHRWLRKNGFESLIKEAVHSQTLGSFFRNDFEGEVPSFVNEFTKKGLTIRGLK